MKILNWLTSNSFKNCSTVSGIKHQLPKDVRKCLYNPWPSEINIQKTCTDEESWLSQVSLGQILVFHTDGGCWKRQQELFIIFGTKVDYCQVKLDKESAELYHSIVIMPLQTPSLRTSNQLPVVKYSNNKKEILWTVILGILIVQMMIILVTILEELDVILKNTFWKGYTFPKDETNSLRGKSNS